MSATEAAAAKFGTPIPVRLRDDDEADLRKLVKSTGLSKSELLRRACQWALPKFLSGEISIVDVCEPEPSNAEGAQA